MRYIFKIKAGKDFVCGEVEGLYKVMQVINGITENFEEWDVTMNSETFEEVMTYGKKSNDDKL